MQVGFQRRFDAGYRAAAEAVATGALGNLLVVRLATHDPAPPPEAYIASSGGIFRDLHIHDFDAVRFVTGQEVVDVYADGAVQESAWFAEHGDVDVAVAVLRMSGGTLAILSGTRHDPRGYDVRLEAFGTARQHRRRARRAHADPLGRARRSGASRERATATSWIASSRPTAPSSSRSSLPSAAEVRSACSLAEAQHGTADRAGGRPFARRAASHRDRGDRAHLGHSRLRPTATRQRRRARNGYRRGNVTTRSQEDDSGLSRRGLIVKGGLLAAGLTAFGAQAGESFAAGTTTKLAVVTHGDTGSFWSVFKNGVDQAAKDLKGRGISVTQVYANNDVSKQVSGINTAIAAKVNVIATSVPDASALKDPLAKAAAKGIEIITVNSGEGAFDALKTYDCHVGQDEKIAGEGAGKQFNLAGAKEVVVIIHEASNSGLTDRAAGVKSTFKGTTKTLLIPNAKADIPGTVAKIKAYFTANKSTDALLGLDPDVTVPALGAAPSGTKVGTFDVSADVIKNLESGQDAVRDRPAAVPAGLPPRRVRGALREQSQHGRRRPARPHRAGNHQQGERREGRRARGQGHALTSAD